MERLAEAGLPSDPDRALVVARWAYQQGVNTSAQLWLRKQEFVTADDQWQEVLAAR